MAVLLLNLVISDGAINGIKVKKHNAADTENGESEASALSHRAIVPKFLPYIGARAFADLTEADLSTKPENWFVARAKDADGKEIKPLDVVSGAQLRGADLRNADATRAFLAKADLRKARLQGANLGWANLQGADLTEARLQGADLTEAQLQEANLFEAQLQEANLFEAQLQEANLFEAQLQEANLYGAQLQEADLSYANLQGATLGAFVLGFPTDLRGANLTGVKNLTQEQLNKACVDEHTKLPKGLKRPKPCPAPEAEQSPQ